jgi:NADH dehydrogenase FAD-containing subunit
VKAAKHIVIAGGGPVGTEAAADIKLRFKDKSVTLVDPNPSVLIAMSAQFQPIAKQMLETAGVMLELNSRVSDVLSNEVVLSSGKKLPCDLYITSFAGKPNTAFVDAG